MYKKGDRVRVWSLQSFHGGGFLEGEPAVVRQSQNKGGSVIVAVVRKINGVYTLDESYEVYAEQLKPGDNDNRPLTDYEKARNDLENFREEIMDNNAIR